MYPSLSILRPSFPEVCVLLICLCLSAGTRHMLSISRFTIHKSRGSNDKKNHRRGELHQNRDTRGGRPPRQPQHTFLITRQPTKHFSSSKLLRNVVLRGHHSNSVAVHPDHRISYHIPRSDKLAPPHPSSRDHDLTHLAIDPNHHHRHPPTTLRQPPQHHRARRSST